MLGAVTVLAKKRTLAPNPNTAPTPTSRIHGVFSYGLGTSRFIERPERGLFVHGSVSGRWWVWADGPHAHSTAGTPAAAAASLETFHVGRARGTSTNGMDSSAPAVVYTATSTAPQSQKTGMELLVRSVMLYWPALHVKE